MRCCSCWSAGSPTGLGLPFTVTGFLPAFLGAIVVSVVGALLDLIIPDTADRC